MWFIRLFTKAKYPLEPKVDLSARHNEYNRSHGEMRGAMDTQRTTTEILQNANDNLGQLLEDLKTDD